MTDFADLKIRVDSSQLKTATDRLNAFGQAASKVQPALGALGAAKQKASGAATHFGNTAGRSAKQLDGFAQQVKELSKVSVLVQGPLGGAAARMITLATVARDFNAVTAAGIVGSAAFASAVTILGVSFIKAADNFKSLEARTKIMVGEMGNAKGTFQELLNIAAKTGSEINTVADVFNRVSLGAKNLGTSNAEIQKTVELVSELGVVSGASTANQQAGLLQFGQAMGQGVVRAEEWNSIMENITALGNEIAAGLGKSTAEVRKMVIDGKLLSKDVFEALQKRTLFIEMQFAKMPKTIARASNEITVAWTRFSGELDKTIGVTDTIANGLSSVAKVIDLITKNLSNLAPYLETAAVVAGVLTLGQAYRTLSVAAIAATDAMLLSYTGAMLPVNKGAAMLTVTLSNLGSILAAVGRLAIVAAAAFGGFKLFEWANSADRAKQSMYDFKKEVRDATDTYATQQYQIIETAKQYDELNKKAKKSKEDQDALNFAVEKVATSLGTSVESVLRNISQYGNLTSATYKLIAAKMVEIETEKVLQRTRDQGVAITAQRFKVAAVKLNPFQVNPFASDEEKARQYKQRSADIKLAQDTLDLMYQQQARDENFIKNKGMLQEKYEKDLIAGANLSNTASTLDTSGKKKNKRDPLKGYKEQVEETTRHLKEQQALLEARNRSEQEYLDLKIKQEATDFIKDKHFPVSPEKENLLIQDEIRKRLLEQQTTAQGITNERVYQLGVEKNLTDARNKSLASFAEEDLKARAIAQYRKETGDWDLLNLSLLEQITEEMRQQEAYIRDREIASLKEEANYTLALANATKLSTAEYIKQANQIELNKKLDSYGGTLTDEQRTAVTESFNKELAAKQITKLTGLDREAEKLNAVNSLMKQGWEWDEVYGERRNKRMERYLYQLEVELEHRNDLIPLSDLQLQKEIDLKVAQDEQAKLLDLQRQKYDALSNAVRNYGQKFLDAFDTALQTGEFNFRKFTLAILQDMAKMIIQAEVISRIFGGKTLTGVTKEGIIMKALNGFLGGTVASGGNPVVGAMNAAATGIGAPSIGAYADGGVFSSPTMGLFGEAGPEAILPLARGSNGKLGVVSNGAGSGVGQYNNITVNVTGSSGTKEQNKDLADQITQQMTREMRGFVTGEIKEQLRKGNMLNPGVKF